MEMPLDAMNDLSDDALLVLYANGDRHAAQALTFRMTPMAYSLASRLLKDQSAAEDVTQEAMLRLWKIAPDWRQGEAKVTTWLYRVVSNLCTDRLRRRRSIALDEIAEPTDDTPGIETRLMENDRAAALSLALDALPERQRKAVVLRHIEGMANPDIADVLMISTEAVESLVSRGKRSLKAMLLRRKKDLGLAE